MNITTCIENASFVELHQIVQASTPTLSFWANRGIKAVGYEGEAPIDALAARVIALVHEKNFEYTPQERGMGKEIAKAINRIYKESVQQIEDSDCLTRFFWNVYSFFNRVAGPDYPDITSMTRWQWESFDLNSVYSRGESYYHRVFEYYTPQQYSEQLGKDPSKRYASSVYGRQLFPEWDGTIVFPPNRVVRS